jgi:hypothetical protein
MKGALSFRRRGEEHSKKSSMMDKRRNQHSSDHSQATRHEYETREIAPVLGPAVSSDVEEDLDLEAEEQMKMQKAAVLNIVALRPYQHWERFASRVLKEGYWSRLGDLAKTLNALPVEIEAIFQRIEKNWPTGHFPINSETRLRFYKEFTRTALGSTVLRFNEVETLIQRMQLATHISRLELNNRMNSKLETAQTGGEHNEFFDFELFASLACDLYNMQRRIEKVAFGPQARACRCPCPSAVERPP